MSPVETLTPGERATVTATPSVTHVDAGATTVTGHLWQIDIVRNLTFACVIAVHATATVNAAASVSAGATLILLHFTREVFFLITGFVLIQAHSRRTFNVTTFYRRRLLLVGVPYVVWSTVYYFANNHQSWAEGTWAKPLGLALLTGTACYHLYFLLVSLQVYLILPALLALLRRTEGRHGLLLGVAVAVQLLEAAFLQYGGPFSGVWETWRRHADVLLPTYVGYLVAGALAAWHLARWQRWVDMHTHMVIGTLLGSATLTLAVYAFQQRAPGGPLYAQAVLQPVMLPWSLAVGLALYSLGSWWACRRTRSRLQGVVTVGSHVSFGVYLLHPLVMQELVTLEPRLPALLATLLLMLVTVVITTVLVMVVQRTPASLPLTGRQRTRHQVA
ncbi:MAG: acyltransferase [Mycobacteriaceae bacterium]